MARAVKGKSKPVIKLNAGDKVFMNDKYHVSQVCKDVVFTVRSEPWDVCGTECVALVGYRGCYAVDGLTKVNDK